MVFRRSSLTNERDREILRAHPEALEYSGALLESSRVPVATVAPHSIVGFATTTVGENRLELVDLFVDPGWMGRGVGRLLIDDASAFAAAGGVGRIEVDGNPDALAFYESVGFVGGEDVVTEFGTGYRMHLDLWR